MKIDFIIVSGILVIISFFPFIIFPLLISKEGKKLRNRFKTEASRLGLNISYERIWNNNRAGIDILKRQFILVQNVENKFQIQHVDLDRVYQIKMAIENREVLQKDKRIETLSKIHLEFYENNSAELKTVNLFDNELNYMQDFEVKNAQILVTELQKYLIGYGKLNRTA